MAVEMLLSNHGRVLACIAQDPQIRVAQIAATVGIKERAVQRILAELRTARIITSQRSGRRNSYRVDRSALEPWAQVPIGKLLDALQR